MTQDLYQAAKAVLRANDAGPFTRPGPRQYPHQWNWDSALIALGLARFDLQRALTEIRSLLAAQWRDGMIPHVVYHSLPSDYFPDAAFWQIENSTYAPPVATSGITQPPLLATVVNKIHARTPIPDFLREAYPALLHWHRWLHTARAPDASGLVCIFHPWESGTDDSPRWLQPLAAITPSGLPDYRRGDTVYVLPDERPRPEDYERFVYLIDFFRRARYDPSTMLAYSPFVVQDVLFNALLHRADEDLRAIAVELGEPVDEIDRWRARMQSGFDNRLWDPERGAYFDYDLRTSAPIRVDTAMTFVPLFAGLADVGRARQLIDTRWNAPQTYGPGADLRYRLTTTSRAEPTWEPRRYWRGPVWIILNWLVSEGLKRYGYEELAASLRSDSLELMARSGFREYYDPRDGSGCGSTDFSWSAALALEWLSEG